MGEFLPQFFGVNMKHIWVATNQLIIGVEKKKLPI